eukprot:CAMPEP_0180492430 /NCGR_PEP_ID=MMETSP1036_2-20121128/40178_1 /TAXON_ID=632150 /ORGANISM="Azadinium spinosum, Strain 3D9" /LENGTH=244 /DNA_ID=CAMNT_0022500757 /DNA_START=75 /DNA_END=809 /DNA_ORIENTATION=+
MATTSWMLDGDGSDVPVTAGDNRRGRSGEAQQRATRARTGHAPTSASAAPALGGGLPQGPGTGSAGGSQAEEDERYAAVAKLSLHSAQMVRALIACVMAVVMLPLTAPLAGMLQRTGRAYSQAVRRDGKGHKHGSPACHYALRLFSYVVHSGQYAQDMIDPAQTFLNNVASKGVSEMMKYVLVLQVKLNYKKDGLRIMLRMKEDVHQKLAVQALVQAGATPLEGEAPASGLERQVQEQLDMLSM